jgi:hypothetical protein
MIAPGRVADRETTGPANSLQKRRAAERSRRGGSRPSSSSNARESACKQDEDEDEEYRSNRTKLNLRFEELVVNQRTPDQVVIFRASCLADGPVRGLVDPGGTVVPVEADVAPLPAPASGLALSPSQWPCTITREPVRSVHPPPPLRVTAPWSRISTSFPVNHSNREQLRPEAASLK